MSHTLERRMLVTQLLPTREVMRKDGTIDRLSLIRIRRGFQWSSYKFVYPGLDIGDYLLESMGQEARVCTVNGDVVVAVTIGLKTYKVTPLEE